MLGVLRNGHALLIPFSRALGETNILNRLQLDLASPAEKVRVLVEVRDVIQVAKLES